MKASEFLKNHSLFTAREFAEEPSSIPDHARSLRTCEALLRYHLGQGHIVRLRRGLYAPVPPGKRPEEVSVNPFVVPSKVAPNSVLGYHAALECHGVAHAPWKQIHYFAATRGRPFGLRRREYVPVLPTAGALEAAIDRC
jgi:predicted transcriptional regulator of viral defense system